MTDVLLPFQLGAGTVRGRLVRLGPSFDTLAASQAYPRVVAALIGQMAALAAALAGALKFDGIFTVQAQGDGPVPLLFADMTSAGHLRAYARFDPTRIPDALKDDPNPANPVGDLLGKGYLAFTVDQGPKMDRYQGIVDLVGPSLADSAHLYFQQSEQLDTTIRLASYQDAGGTWRAGALMLSRMPAGGDGAPILTAAEWDESWRRCNLLLGTLGDAEFLDPELAPEKLLWRLFHQEVLEVFPPRGLEAKCRCSRAKIATTLRSLPRAEILELADAEGTITVTCEFCQTAYPFSDADLLAVYMP